jgi:four helix bundle protein
LAGGWQLAVGRTGARYGCRTNADQRRFLEIARGSVQETEHWIARARRRGLIHDDYSDRIVAIARALNALTNSKRGR